MSLFQLRRKNVIQPYLGYTFVIPLKYLDSTSICLQLQVAFICIHLKGSWRIELNGLIRVPKIWFILPWPWTSCASAQELPGFGMKTLHAELLVSTSFDHWRSAKVKAPRSPSLVFVVGLWISRAQSKPQENRQKVEISIYSKYFSMKSC